MFDFEPGKLMVIGAVALVVIGPKELPRVLRQVGQTVSKVRRMAADFQSQFMDAMREAELSDVKEEMSKIADSAKIDVAFDPVRDIRNQIGGALSHSTASLSDVAAMPAIADLPAMTGTPGVSAAPVGAFEAPAIAGSTHAPIEAADAAAVSSSSHTTTPEGLVAAGIAPVAIIDPRDAAATQTEATTDAVRHTPGHELDQATSRAREETKPVEESAA